MLIVDAQVHIWRGHTPTRPLHRPVTDFTADDLLRRQCVTLFAEELPWLSERDKELIMGGALCTWLDWRRPA